MQMLFYRGRYMDDDTETADPEKLQAIEGYEAERLVQKSRSYWGVRRRWVSPTFPSSQKESTSPKHMQYIEESATDMGKISQARQKSRGHLRRQRGGIGSCYNIPMPDAEEIRNKKKSWRAHINPECEGALPMNRGYTRGWRVYTKPECEGALRQKSARSQDNRDPSVNITNKRT